MAGRTMNNENKSISAHLEFQDGSKFPTRINVDQLDIHTYTKQITTAFRQFSFSLNAIVTPALKKLRKFLNVIADKNIPSILGRPLRSKKKRIVRKWRNRVWERQLQ